MKPNYYKIIEDCVASGVAIGYISAHKHEDKPDRSVLKENIIEAIMDQISNKLIFDTLP
jgi:hypothetical protein